MPLNPITTTWPLLLGMGILMLGAGLQGTILGLRATLEGFPTPVTGLVMSCYYVGYLLGTLVAPRLLRDVAPQSRIACDEVFGPVLIAMPFGDEPEAIQLANGTGYGLVTGVWTSDGGRQLRLAHAI